MFNKDTKTIKNFIIFLLALCIAIVFCAAGCSDGQSDVSANVQTIEMQTLPDKTTYYLGETILYDGATVKVTYVDGTTEVLPILDDMFEIGSVNTNRVGEKTVTVRVKGGTSRQRTTFTINVIEQDFTFTYDLNYEGSTSEVVSIVSGAKASRPDDPEREGYTFYNWFIDENCTMLYDFDTAVTSDVTIYAKWMENGVTYHDFTFDLNYYGVAVQSYTQIVKDGESAIGIPQPARDEFAFNGWYWDDAATTSFELSQPITQSTTVYAGWTKTKTGTSSYIFEAENTDLSGKVGPGASGEAVEGGMIVVDSSRGASGDKYVSYLYRNGLSLEFDIACSEDVSDVELAICLTAEMDITITDSTYTVVVYNGEDDEEGTTIRYGALTFGRNDQFAERITATISLKKGYNRVCLTTANSDNPAGEGVGTYAGTAPMIDYIRLTTSAVLTWDGTKGLPCVY